MEQVAELGCLIIKYIEEFEFANTVGVGNRKPQVWFIPDANAPQGATEEDKQKYNPRQAVQSQLEISENNAKKRIEKYGKSVQDDFKLQT